MPTYHYAYDSLGNQTTQTTPNGGTTRFHFDFEGRSIGRTLPLGVATPDSVDPNDFREWTYYELGISSEGGDLVYGQTRETIDFEGRRTRMLYDNRVGAGGRVKQVEYFVPGNSTTLADERITYAYDSFGRQVEANRFLRENGSLVLKRTESTTYDTDGRVKSIIHSGTEVGATPQRLFYDYDAFGRHERTYSGTLTDAINDTRYTYDPFGRLKTVSVVERFNTQLASPETTTYGYDRVGNLDWTDLPGTMAIDYVYDDQHRLIDEIYFADTDGDHFLDWNDSNSNGLYNTGEGETPFHRFQTTRDIEGRRVASVDTSFRPGTTPAGNGVNTVDEYRWSYDEAGRLSKEEYTRRVSDSPTAWGYTDYHAYDLNSNRTRVDRAVFGTPAGGDLKSSIRRMTFDANDRLTNETIDYAEGVDSTQDFTYGPNNSWTKLTRQVKSTGGSYEEVQYTYDAAGRQKTRTIGDYAVYPYYSLGPHTQTFGYSIEGDRVRQQGGLTNLNETYLVDPLSPTGYSEVFEKTGGGLQTHYTLGHAIIGQTAGTTLASGPTKLYVTDPLGSVRNALDISPTWAFYTQPAGSYDAFGNVINTNSELLNTAVGYAGQMTDLGWNSNAGQIYSRARYYQPGTGTFTTLDPYIGNPQNPLSLHKYLYVHADPVNGTDPSGWESLSTIQVNAAAFTQFVASNVGAAFAAGGPRLGQFLQAIGRNAEQFASSVIRLLPQIQMQLDVRIGSRVLDRVLSYGGKDAILEIKYRLPSASSEAFNRLVSQLQQAISSGKGQTVV
jgi:RHS repeat-associated protein